MKTYKILVDARTANDYIMGRISGIIYVLTGMPKRQYPWERNHEYDWTMMFDAENDTQAWAVADCLNNMHPTSYLGMICVE